MVNSQFYSRIKELNYFAVFLAIYIAKEGTIISIAIHLVSLFSDPMSDDTMDWIYLVQCGTFTKTLMKFPLLNEARNLLTVKGILASL
jgi:hypothetical protein